MLILWIDYPVNNLFVVDSMNLLAYCRKKMAEINFDDKGPMAPISQKKQQHLAYFHIY